VENRNGLIAAAMATHADGYAERDAALLMLKEKQEGRSRRITVGADKAYDTKDFVSTARELNVTPHVTKNDNERRSNLDRRTTRQPGCALSLSRRWLVEKGFGWLKQTGPLRQVKLRGLEKVDWLFVFSCAAHNLIRLPRLIAQQPPARLKQQGVRHSALQTRWSFRCACNRASWWRRDPFSSAGLTGFDPTPESGSSHPRTTPARVPVD
jgi:hypothetical protein